MLAKDDRHMSALQTMYSQDRTLNELISINVDN